MNLYLHLNPLHKGREGNYGDCNYSIQTDIKLRIVLKLWIKIVVGVNDNALMNAFGEAPSPPPPDTPELFEYDDTVALLLTLIRRKTKKWKPGWLTPSPRQR